MSVESVPEQVDPPIASAAPVPGVKGRAITAAIIGHAIEFYDFVIFGAFAPVLATVFFPESSRVAALLSVFVIYAVAYLSRPIGAVIFGHIGDRKGRKTSLAAAILLMVGATIVIGLTPTAAAIGIWATIILVVARVLQGISVGGEFGGALSYLVEIAPKGKRGLYGSAQMFAAGIGLLTGSVVGAVITGVVSEQALHDWGWRLAFLLATPAGLVGLYIRLKLEDTPKFAALERHHEIPKTPLFELLRHHWRNLLIGIGLVLVFTVSFSTWHIYMPAHLKEVVGMDFHTALVVSAIGLGFLVVCSPLVGMLSDRVGRRPLAIVGTLGLTVMSYPAFIVLDTGNVALIVPVALLMFGLLAVMSVSITMILTETFPTRIRVSGVAVAYATGVAVFGATAPLFQTWLVDWTGDSLSPAWYQVVAGAVSLALLLSVVRETARTELR